MDAEQRWNILQCSSEQCRKMQPKCTLKTVQRLRAKTHVILNILPPSPCLSAKLSFFLPSFPHTIPLIISNSLVLGRLIYTLPYPVSLPDGSTADRIYLKLRQPPRLSIIPSVESLFFKLTRQEITHTHTKGFYWPFKYISENSLDKNTSNQANWYLDQSYH